MKIKPARFTAITRAATCFNFIYALLAELWSIIAGFVVISNPATKHLRRAV
jgi:hypothetical protein